MFRLSANFLNVPLLSLRTGGEVGVATQPIINPNNLKIEGWYCTDKFSKQTMVILSQDVREILPQGMAVNDHDVMSPPSELIRLQPIMNIRFELLGKVVVTDQKRRVGKVIDYAVDIDSLIIQKLYVEQPLYKTIRGGQLSIDRNQIIEITDKQVKVKDVDLRVGDAVVQPVPAA